VKLPALKSGASLSDRSPLKDPMRFVCILKKIGERGVDETIVYGSQFKIDFAH
jgi:hypothetical protein